MGADVPMGASPDARHESGAVRDHAPDVPPDAVCVAVYCRPRGATAARPGAGYPRRDRGGDVHPAVRRRGHAVPTEYRFTVGCGALNTNPHFHSILPDGLFVPNVDGRLSFKALPSPNDDDVANLTKLLAGRLGAIAENFCRDREGIRPDNDDAISMIRAAAAEAQKVPLNGEHFAGAAPARQKPLCGKQEGFTLHAATVVAAADRAGLERLCRYGLRAPFALDRFSVDPDGMVRYRLPRPWPTPTGRTELSFEPQALLRRFAALLPAPYFNLVRYYVELKIMLSTDKKGA